MIFRFQFFVLLGLGILFSLKGYAFTYYRPAPSSPVLEKSINEIGFENTANIYSISNTSKNGGLIGWVNELQLSAIIKKNIILLNDNEVTKPIKINNGFLIIKLNNKREFKEEVDIDKQVEELANKEMNRQLNSFSMILFKRLKKNIQINEL